MMSAPTLGAAASRRPARAASWCDFWGRGQERRGKERAARNRDTLGTGGRVPMLVCLSRVPVDNPRPRASSPGSNAAAPWGRGALLEGGSRSPRRLSPPAARRHRARGVSLSLPLTFFPHSPSTPNTQFSLGRPRPGAGRRPLGRCLHGWCVVLGLESWLGRGKRRGACTRRRRKRPLPWPREIGERERERIRAHALRRPSTQPQPLGLDGERAARAPPLRGKRGVVPGSPQARTRRKARKHAHSAPAPVLADLLSTSPPFPS